MSMAGALVRHEAAGFWWAAVPKEQWPVDPENRAAIEQRFSEPFGDRKQEIVFTGTREMDETQIRALLDQCLVDLPKTGAVDSRLWKMLDDPFPLWERREAAT